MARGDLGDYLFRVAAHLQNIAAQNEEVRARRMQEKNLTYFLAQKMKESQQEEQANQALANVSPDIINERITSGITNTPEGYDVADPTSMITERTPKPDEQYYGEAFEAVKPISMKHAMPFLTAKRGAVKERITKEEEARKNPMLTSEQLTGKAPLPMMPASTAYHYRDKEKEAKAPTTRHYTRGNEEITEEYDAEQKKWIPVANAPRYKPDTGASGLPKPPKDFRYTADGELEPIPGGKEDTKRRTNYAKADKQYRGITSGLKTLKKQTEKLRDHPGLSGITGARGAVPNFPGSDAANADAILEQLKSRTGLDVLQNMRLLSPTGGALGNVSDAEGKRLETYIAALSKAQSKKAMKDALQDIINYADEAERNLKDGFEQTFSDSDKERYGGKKVGTPQAPSSKFKILKVE